jgi:hypothetical protein
MFYVASRFSTFPWHFEDNFLYVPLTAYDSSV